MISSIPSRVSRGISADSELRKRATALVGAGYTTRAIAMRLDVAWKTADRLCRPVSPKDPAAIGSSVYLDRREWAALMTAMPDATRAKLRKRGPALYMRLYRNDGKWLRQQSCAPAARAPVIRVNWLERDAALALQVEVLAEQIRARNPPVRVVQSAEPAERYLNTRMFEPSTIGLNTLGTDNCSFDIEDLSAVSAVIEPREVLGPMLRITIFDRHAIYSVEMQRGRFLIPAWLLVNELWVCALDVLPALMCPNSLDVLIGRTCLNAGVLNICASTQLASNSPSATALRRIAWLAQSVDARIAWNSILSHAYNGDLNLVLP